ncbi:hypothetical protein GGR52DRAFT_303874 [Hypoxylon sp. FL1284]|nr:hypothetical protein GGR52DRAFT_303874 [Hypoxylon sp. FL1284]
MVGVAEVSAANEEFARLHHDGCVCVFMGATAGIGQSTLQRMVTLLDKSTFYVLVRNPTEYTGKLESLSVAASARKNKVVLIEAQVSLIADVDAACDRIIAEENKIDYLCMSPGGMPFGGAVYTNEGLETCFAISYYSRPRMVSKLLPLLRRSPEPHVLSILNGTLERPIKEDDLGLDKDPDKSWSITAVVNHTTVCTSLAFDYLSKHNEASKIVFLHATPGFVSTDSPRKTRPSRQSGIVWWAFISTMQVISGWIIYYFGMAVKESGERHSFHLISSNFKPGSWQINKHSEALPPNKVLRQYQERGWAEKVWDHTLHVWDKALASGSPSINN